MIGATPSDAVLMTLAGIAYGAPGSVAGYVAQALGSTWRVAWLPVPADPPVNFAYLAVEDASGAAVLAIRGTYPDPFSAAYWDDGNQDSPFGDMVDWPGAPGARISGGTATGLANLLALIDDRGATLADAVAALPASAALTVTGHSLGGTLAPVVALRLAEAGGGLSISATSFAGMTPGNAAFAALFASGGAFGGTARRVFNTLDTVSYGWDKVLDTRGFYQPAPQGGAIVTAMLALTAARLAEGGYDYAPVGDAVPLTGSVRPPSIACDLIAYVLENLHQHMPDTYLALLGAPPLPFTIGFGTVVQARGATAAAEHAEWRLPVIHIESADNI